MSCTSDCFSTDYMSSNNNSFDNTYDYTVSNYSDVDSSNCDSPFLDKSGVELSWTTVDYGGQVINDGLF